MHCMVALFLSLILETASASPFRVLVFPHLGQYPVPQGKESVVSRVKISSEEVCDQYVAQLNANQEWEKSGNLITSSKTYSLNNPSLRRQAKNLSTDVEAFYYECSKPFKVWRESTLESYSYEGSFVAVFDRSGKNKAIHVVNLIEPEKYLQGVVPTEVGSDWPKEALKAQAVAARTYAWWTVLDGRTQAGSIYDLDDTVQYQAYTGISKRTDATDEAVSETANQTMKYDGKVIKAYFSADSGGKTESAKNRFGQDLPYCQSKTELYDLSKTTTDWTITLSLNEVGTALGLKVKSISVAAEDINESGRVDQLIVLTSNNQKVIVPSLKFRQALKLRSALFQLSSSAVNGVEMLQIKGKGYGHGVGMAQIGAREYANQLSWTFDQILKFYYTGITIEPVTNEYFE